MTLDWARARVPRVNTMFHVAILDEGCIVWVNGHAVTHLVQSLDGLALTA
jgi:hypothetical protein